MIKYKDYVKKIYFKSYYYYHKGHYKYLGKNVWVNPTAGIVEKNHISIGDGTFIGKDCTFLFNNDAYLSIGKYAGISPHVKILGGDRDVDTVGIYFMTIPAAFKGSDLITTIEDDVMIGMGTIILKAVKIGEGAVIGAGSVINKSILPYTVAVGNPGKMVKLRFTIEKIEKHLNLLKSKYLLSELIDEYKKIGLVK